MFRFLFLLAALAAAFPCFSQDFLPGYVVTHSGDTLRGNVLNGSFRTKSHRVVFRAGGSTNPTTYSPKDLRAYLVGTEGYVRADVDGTPVFLRELVYGRFTLASLKQGGLSRFFLVNASQATELTATSYYQEVRKATYGCPPLPLAEQSAFERTYPFQEIALVKLFTDLNACPANAPIASGRRFRTNRLSSKTGVYIGSNWARLIVPTPHPSGQIRNLGGFHLGAQRQWGLFETVSLQTELYFSNSKAIEDIDDANSQQKWTNVHRISTLSVPLLLNVTFRPGARLRPYGQVGYQFSMNLGGISEYRQYDGLNGIQVEQKRVEGGLNGFILGTGLEYAIGRYVPFLAARYSTEYVRFNDAIKAATPKRSTSYQGWHFMVGMKW